MIIFSDATKHRLLFKVKVISSLFVFACIDQFSFFHFLPFQPSFSIIALFFWTFFFNKQISFNLVFLFGLFVDLIGGSFLGENTLIFVILYGSISFYKDNFSNDLSLEWPIFWTSIFLVIFLHFFLIGIIHKRFIFTSEPILGNFLTLLFYPGIRNFLRWLINEKRYL
jgi:cell shape-determining protein MreD